jgi:FlaA1/EpsC-like NDP-sugar epimerase
VAPDAQIEMVGIRPGEKLHEEMITTTDALGTLEFDEYFVILPATRLWDTEQFRRSSNGAPGRPCAPGFSYNSGTNSRFIAVDELRRLINAGTGT